MSSPAAHQPRRATRPAVICFGLVLLLLVLAVLRLHLGSSFAGGIDFRLPRGQLWTSLWHVFRSGFDSGANSTSLLDLRMQHVVMAVLVGVALAASGVALQALL